MYIVQVCLSVCLTVCLNIQGYCVKHLSDNKAKNTRKGRYSGGIYIYDKSNLYGKIEITQKHQNRIVWLKIDKSLFYFNIDSYMCCTYIPPKGSTLLNSEEFDVFEQIKRDVSKYQHLGKILLTRDFKSCTSTEPHFITFYQFLNADLFVQSDLERYPRVNKDDVFDAHGSKLIELCKVHYFTLSG